MADCIISVRCGVVGCFPGGVEQNITPGGRGAVEMVPDTLRKIVEPIGIIIGFSSSGQEPEKVCLCWPVIFGATCGSG